MIAAGKSWKRGFMFHSKAPRKALCFIFLAFTACQVPNLPENPLPSPSPNPETSTNATPTPMESGGSSSSPTPVPSSSSSGTGSTNPVITLPQNKIMDEVISVFENSTPDLQYDYIAVENDGRGYTAGRAGFTSRDGDMLEVIQAYLKLKSSSPLSTVVTTLENLNRKDSGSVSGLSSLPSLWKQACLDPLFIQTQDQISDELYFVPALERVRQLKIVSQIGVLIIYDASIEHGVDGADGVDDMVSKMGNLSQYKTEKDLLTAFSKVRRATLLNPADASTREAWSESVGRVDALQAILESGNLNLNPPLKINPFGDEFVIME